MPSTSLRRLQSAVLTGLFVYSAVSAWAGAPPTCETVIVTAEVSAGQEWKIPIGEGWIFRIVPISPSQSGYTGWDLVVDRVQPAGFPDALYLATPPYGSINQREIGTTFGLRAQDSIGWNPRSFHFLTDPKSLAEAQKLYQSASQAASGSSANSGSAAARLLELQKTAATGELRILDARLVPGIADPAPFAQEWAMAASRTGYRIESAAPGQSSPRGALRWMRFRVTLWLPSGWSVPRELHATRAACGG